MKVYTIEAENKWNDFFYVDSVYATQEAAVKGLKEMYDDVVYDEQYDCYERPGSDTEYYIREYGVRS